LGRRSPRLCSPRPLKCQRPAQRGSNCSNQRVQAPQPWMRVSRGKAGRATLEECRHTVRQLRRTIVSAAAIAPSTIPAAACHAVLRLGQPPCISRMVPRPGTQGRAQAPAAGHTLHNAPGKWKKRQLQAQWPTVATPATAAAAVGPTTTAAAAAEAAATAAAAAVVLARGACTEPSQVHMRPEQPALTHKLTARARAAAVKIRAPYKASACAHEWLVAVTRARIAQAVSFPATALCRPPNARTLPSVQSAGHKRGGACSHPAAVRRRAQSLARPWCGRRRRTRRRTPPAHHPPGCGIRR